MKKVLSLLSAIVIGSSLISTPTLATDNNSKPVSNTIKKQEIPEVKGTELSKEESLKVYENIINKIKGEKSFSLKGETTLSAEGSSMVIPFSLLMDMENAQFKGETSVMGNKASFYLVDKKLYFLDPTGKEGAWIHMPISPELFKTDITISPRVFDIFKIEKTASGYVLKSPKDLTIEELAKKIPELDFFINYIYLNVKEAALSRANTIQDEEMIEKVKDAILKSVKINLQVEYTEDFLPKEYYLTYNLDLKTVDDNAPQVDVFSKFEYGDFSSIEKIELPKELEDAKFMSEMFR